MFIIIQQNEGKNETGCDSLTKFRNETKREPYAALCARARAFFEWLGQRPEREVAVVGHSAWLFTVLNAVLAVEGEAAPHGEGARRWFLTGELRTLRVRFRTSEL